MFKSTPATPAQPTGVNNPGQPLPGTQANPGTDNNGVVPVTPDPNASPLDKFNKVWETDPNAKAPENPAEMFANLDPAKIQEASKKVDFSKVVTQENLAKITAGGPEAAKAFMESMNAMAQQTYAQSAMATTKIVEQALSKQQASFDAQLPTMVKRLSSSEALNQNPVFSNPALKPVVDAMQQTLIQKNPNATVTEINQQLNDYFNAVGLQFAPKAPETPASKAKASETDWEKFFE